MAEKVTKLSTKDVIWNAYQEQVKKVKELETVKLDPAKELAGKKATVILQKAEEITTASIGSKAKETLDVVAKALMEMVDQLEKETENYNSIKEAIALKQKELKELFNIEADASSLAAIINSKNDILDMLDSAIAQKRVENAEVSTKLDADYAAKKAALEAEIKRINSDNLVARAKEEAEYKYTFNRQKMLDRDAWEDEKTKMRREFEADKAADQAELTDRFKTVEVKEAELVKREALVNDLEAKVAEIPALIDSATAKAVADKEKSMNTAFAIEKNYLKKDAESQAALANTKIEGLTERLGEANDKIRDLTEKLNTAYSEIKDMAAKAVESASNSRYAVSLEQTLRDTAKNVQSK